MNRSLRVGAGVAAALFCAGCAGGNAAPNGDSGDTRYIAAQSAVQLVPVQHRHHVSFHGGLLGGGTLNLAALRGRVVVVNFWASWCPDCRVEAPYLQRVYERTHPVGVDFLGVDVRDSAVNARVFREHAGIEYPSLFDEPGIVALAFRNLPPTAQPSTVVIDRDGREAARFIGPVLYSTLLQTVQAVAAESA